MSYDLLILVFLILIFCFFSMMLTVNVMFRLINSKKDEWTDFPIQEIKMSDIVGSREKEPKKSEYELFLEEQEKEKQERYNTIMENLEAYDGTEIGQKEVK